MHLVGTGSLADRRLVREGHVSLPGKVVTVARHLGSHLGEKASFTHELPRRRQATMAAFYSVGQLWYESILSWRLKRCFFISRVVNTALSGIEAFCPSKAQYQALTSLVTCLARRVMAGAAARRGEHGRVCTLTNKEVLRFWKLAPCDVEARVRRLKWAQTLLQDPSHHAQVLTAMFGKLPAEPSPTLGPDGEITPEANPWAVRWMEDLEALQSYDERGVVQRMEKDVRALFLDRELAADFVAIDVSVLRLQSLSTQGCLLGTSGRKWVTQWKCRKKECHSGGVALTISVRRSLSLLRLLRRMCCDTTDKWRRCPDLHSPISVLCVWRCTGIEKRLIVISCLLFVVGPVVIDLVTLVKCTFHTHSVALSAQLNLEIGQSANCTWRSIRAVCPMDFEMPAWEKRKSEEAPQSQGRRAVRQAVAEGSSEREVLRRLVDVLATLSLVNAAELRDLHSGSRQDLHSVQDIPGHKLGKRGRRNGRGRSALPRLRWRNQEQARSRARRRSRATRSPFRVRVGSVPAQLGFDKGVGSRTRGSSEAVLGEQRVEERTSAVGVARSVLQSEAVQESRGQGRVDAHCVLPGPDHPLPSREHWRQHCGCRKGWGKYGTAPRGPPPRTRSSEAPDADVRRIERLARRVEQHSQRMAGLLRRGVLEPSLAYAFLMTKGRATDSTDQIQGQSSGNQPGDDKWRSLRLPPDTSPPRPPPERPPMVFTRGETMEPSNAGPEVRTSRRAWTPYLPLDTVAWLLHKEWCDSEYCCMAPAQEWHSRSEMGSFFSWTIQRYGLHKDDTHKFRSFFFSLWRTHGSLLKDDTHKSSCLENWAWREHGPCAKMTIRDTEKISLTHAQGDTQFWVWMIVSPPRPMFEGAALVNSSCISGLNRCHRALGPIRLMRRPAGLSWSSQRVRLMLITSTQRSVPRSCWVVFFSHSVCLIVTSRPPWESISSVQRTETHLFYAACWE